MRGRDRLAEAGAGRPRPFETYAIARSDTVTPTRSRLDRDEQCVADADPVFDPIAAVFEVFHDAAQRRRGHLKPHRFRPTRTSTSVGGGSIHGEHERVAEDFHARATIGIRAHAARAH